MITLAERFAKSGGKPQEVDGITVHNIYRKTISQGFKVRICRINAKGTPTQGLRMKVVNGSISLDGNVYKDVVLWGDNSPSEVELICNTSKRSASELRIWNCWRDNDGVMQAWIGEAGMAIEEDGNYIVLRCSDGTQSFSPSDLVVKLQFVSVPAT